MRRMTRGLQDIWSQCEALLDFILGVIREKREHAKHNRRVPTEKLINRRPKMSAELLQELERVPRPKMAPGPSLSPSKIRGTRTAAGSSNIRANELSVASGDEIRRHPLKATRPPSLFLFSIAVFPPTRIRTFNVFRVFVCRSCRGGL